jgi:Ca2+-transporting ATPase
LAIIAVTTIGFLQRIVGTVDLSLSQWLMCVGLAATLVVIEELIKFVVRRRERAQGAPRHAVAVS